MLDLNGEFRHKVDAKGRLSLPAKFRKALPTKDLVVSINPKDECLYVFEDGASFNEWVEQLFIDKYGQYNSSKSDHLNLRRKLKARAKDVEMDGSGRIVIPPEQRKSLGIEKDVVLIGNTGYFEVWDAKRWDEVDNGTDLGDLVD